MIAVARAVARLPRLVALGAIRVYQVAISPLLGPRCKYYPSCSHYGFTAVERFGLVRGGTLAAWRILRCNPWSHGGVDDVPEPGEPLFHRMGNRPSPQPVRRAATVQSGG